MTSVSGPVDFHSHLVPDVDDGARGIDGALAAVGRMVDAGFRKLITTPHLDGSLQEDETAFAARLAEVAEGFRTLEAAVHGRWPDLEMRQGFEIMLDIPDIDFTDPRLRIPGTDFVLVEWPRLQIPPGTERVIERMLRAGVRPIIAHPERYGGIEHMGDLPRRWCDMGVFLQVNWGSVVGRYGASARRVAFRMLRHGEAHYLASDFHGREHTALNFDEARETFAKVDGAEAFRVLTETNPRRLWENEPPMPAPLLRESTGFMAKLRRMMGSDE